MAKSPKKHKKKETATVSPKRSSKVKKKKMLSKVSPATASSTPTRGRKPLRRSASKSPSKRATSTHAKIQDTKMRRGGDSPSDGMHTPKTCSSSSEKTASSTKSERSRSRTLSNSARKKLCLEDIDRKESSLNNTKKGKNMERPSKKKALNKIVSLLDDDSDVTEDDKATARRKSKAVPLKTVKVKTEPGLKQAPAKRKAKEKNINGKKNSSKIIRQTDLTEDDDMIVLANEIGRKIDPTDEKSFRKMSLKKKIERAIEGIIPTYLGFMFNQLVAKIGPEVGMESDPDIMKKPVAGKKKIVELVLLYHKRCVAKIFFICDGNFIYQIRDILS